MDEDQLKQIAQEFGTVDHVQIVKNRNTGEHKGFGYVKYERAYDAALALENMDRSYKAVMAEPKAAKMKRDIQRENQFNTNTGNPGFTFAASSLPVASRPINIGGLVDPHHGAPLLAFHQPVIYQDGGGGMAVRSSGAIGNRLQVNCATQITPEQLSSLFGLIPGMELCDLKRNFSTGESRGVAIVVYNSVGTAIYAKEKLNGFEYPPGFRISVRYAQEDEQLDFAGGDSKPVMGGGAHASGVGSMYCSAQLPPLCPLADAESCECAGRLFVVCQPTPPPTNALIDTFCRFGDLLDVFMLKDKNFGYAKYASAEAAAEAMKVLHGVEICGKKIKVLAAEPPKTAENARKRPRT